MSESVLARRWCPPRRCARCHLWSPLEGSCFAEDDDERPDDCPVLEREDDEDEEVERVEDDDVLSLEEIEAREEDGGDRDE